MLTFRAMAQIATPTNGQIIIGDSARFSSSIESHYVAVTGPSGSSVQVDYAVTIYYRAAGQMGHGSEVAQKKAITTITIPSSGKWAEGDLDYTQALLAAGDKIARAEAKIRTSNQFPYDPTTFHEHTFKLQ